MIIRNACFVPTKGELKLAYLGISQDIEKKQKNNANNKKV
jgi:hypothetical protein